MSTLLNDLRYGLRMLAKNPGFTAVAVLTLALGIGANTAIFSVVDAVLLRPLPYRHSEQLVKIWTRFTGIGLPNDENDLSAPEIRDVEELQKSFTRVAAFEDNSFNITINGNPERIEGANVSTSLFSILGAQPSMGRVFAPEEGQPGRDGELLMSYGLWQRRFGSDPGVVGSKLVANGRPYVVVGILPKGFDYPDQAEIWAPLAFDANDLSPNSRGGHGYEMVARLNPGVSLAQARAEVGLVSQTMIEQNPGYPYKTYNFALIVNPLLQETVGDARGPLWVLMGAVGFVLLIACANIAGLLLVRASARRRENAIRLALGASPLRLARQLVTESSILGILGGGLGLLIGVWALHGLVVLTGTSVPRLANSSVDGWVMAFTAVVSIGTGVLIGLVPAFQAARGMPYETLKEGGHDQAGAAAGAVSTRARRMFVMAETALALVLLTGAGLLLKSLVRLLNVDPGFRPDHVLTMRIALPPEKYGKPEQVRGFYNHLLDGIQRLPGVVAAGAVNVLPLAGSNFSGTVTIDTQAVPADQTTPEADRRNVMPGYFKAMGIPLVAGRFFDDRDTESSPLVAVIDETLARTYWPNESPIGKRIRLGDSKTMIKWMTIVGEVRHVRYRTLEAPSRVELYWPEAQRPGNFMSLTIRAAGDPMALAPTVEKEIHALDPDQPAYQVRTMQEVMANSVEQRRVTLSLLGLFAGAALLLAAIGLYGTISYSVAQRSHEIGIRMALGAERTNVLRLILGQGMKLALGGIALGLVGALALTWLLSAMLFGVRAIDPVTFLGVSVLLFAVALFASYIPARRATKVDPMVALRYE